MRDHILCRPSGSSSQATSVLWAGPIFAAILTVAAATIAAQGQATKAPPVVSPEVLPDRRVAFRIHAPKANEVLLSGEWMGPRDKPLALTKSDDGVWSATAGPLEPNVYTYEYIVDGVRTTDPSSSETVVTADRFPYSVVEVRGDIARPWEKRAVS